MTILIIIIIAAVIIERLGNRGHNGWWTRLCPHCKQRIAMKATRCPWCSGEVQPQRFELR